MATVNPIPEMASKKIKILTNGEEFILLSEKGWVLSPAYDINPNEFGRGLSLNISEDDNALDLNLVVPDVELEAVSLP